MKYFYLVLVFVLLLLVMFLYNKKTEMNEPVAEEKNSQDHTGHATKVVDEKSFLLQMIPHHQEAIDTSIFIASKSADPEVKKLAEEIASAQIKEIEMMRMWIKDWYDVEYVADNTYVPMMSDLSALLPPALEKTYLEDMIVHHFGAIVMAEAAEKFTLKPEVSELVKNIITTQEKEISTMSAYLEVRGLTGTEILPPEHTTEN